MRPHLSILLLITFSSFLHPIGASHAQNQPGMYEYHTDDEWRELMSFLNPVIIVDKFQEAPIISTLFGITVPRSMHRVQPEAPTSPNSLDSRPAVPKRNLGTMFFEEAGKIIRSFETVVNSTVALGTAFNVALESASSDNFSSNNGPYAPVLKMIAMFVATMRDDFEARFPLPSTAPGHAKRSERVAEVLQCLQRDIMRIAMKRGVAPDVIEHRLAGVKPLLRNVAVLVGDVAELYPSAIEALVLHASAILFPEAAFLRSLVILGCLGPYVLGQDALSGWLLKHS